MKPNPNKMPAQQRDPKTGRWLPKPILMSSRTGKSQADSIPPEMIDRLADDAEKSVDIGMALAWIAKRLLTERDCARCDCDFYSAELEELTAENDQLKAEIERRGPAVALTPAHLTPENLLRHEIEELRRERDAARALYSELLRRVNVLPFGASTNFILPSRYE